MLASYHPLFASRSRRYRMHVVAPKVYSINRWTYHTHPNLPHLPIDERQLGPFWAAVDTYLHSNPQ